MAALWRISEPYRNVDRQVKREEANFYEHGPFQMERIKYMIINSWGEIRVNYIEVLEGAFLLSEK
jgi:hypothetical protein